MKKPSLRYVVTSKDRPDDPNGSPHKIPGNAMDLTLRTGKDYSGMKEYKDLMKYMFDNWQYRAGADLTPSNGNVHIHLDMGLTQATKMPYFFVEDSGRFIKQIKSKEEIV